MRQVFGFHSEHQRLQSLEKQHRMFELGRQACWYVAGGSTIVTLYWNEATGAIPLPTYTAAAISGVAGAVAGTYEWLTSREQRKCHQLVGQLACSEAIAMEQQADNRDLVEACDRIATENLFIRQPQAEDLE